MLERISTIVEWRSGWPGGAEPAEPDTRDFRSTSSKSKQHLASPRLTMQEGIDRSQLHSDTFTAATCTCAFFVWDESLWLEDRWLDRCVESVRRGWSSIFSNLDGYWLESRLLECL